MNLNVSIDKVEDVINYSENSYEMIRHSITLLNGFTNAKIKAVKIEISSMKSKIKSLEKLKRQLDSKSGEFSALAAKEREAGDSIKAKNNIEDDEDKRAENDQAAEAHYNKASYYSGRAEECRRIAGEALGIMSQAGAVLAKDIQQLNLMSDCKDKFDALSDNSESIMKGNIKDLTKTLEAVNNYANTKSISGDFDFNLELETLK